MPARMSPRRARRPPPRMCRGHARPRLPRKPNGGTHASKGGGASRKNRMRSGSDSCAEHISLSFLGVTRYIVTDRELSRQSGSIEGEPPVRVHPRQIERDPVPEAPQQNEVRAVATRDGQIAGAE